MIFVDPGPEELAIAHAGRAAHVNECASLEELSILLRRASGQAGGSRRQVPRLEQLAYLARQPLPLYAAQHTLGLAIQPFRTPLRQAVASAGALVTGPLRRGGPSMHPQIAGARLCEQCVEGDLREHPYSWYRRVHHVHGVEWCPTHQTALLVVDDPYPFLRTPDNWVREGKIAPIHANHEKIQHQGKILGRYTTLVGEIMKRGLALDRVDVQRLLRGWHGKRAAGSPLKAWLSDRIQEEVSPRWLTQHIPDWKNKRRGVPFPRLDDLMRRLAPTTRSRDFFLAAAATLETQEIVMQSTSRHGA